jgi:phospholipid/cholesterol/gamma-HCH transport system ATP-binding protein
MKINWKLFMSVVVAVVVVTHELASIFATGNNSVFLDVDSRTMLASGDPKELVANAPDPKVYRFLSRGGDKKPEKWPTLVD